MRHDWILDVLADLRAYALTNGLPQLATELDAALRTAGREIAGGSGGSGDGGGGPPGAPPRAQSR